MAPLCLSRSVYVCAALAFSPFAWSAPAAVPASPTVPAAAPAGGLTQSARVLWLDKQSNTRTPLVLAAGVAQSLNGLTLSLTKCVPDYAGQPGQDIAWLDVREAETRQTPWFAGWMFSTAPEVSTLDHPRYDVQLQGCGSQPRRIGRAASAVDTVSDAAPPADSEAPSGTTAEPDAPASAPVSGTTPEAPASSDPYYVPGVDAQPKPAPQADEKKPTSAPQQAETAPAEKPAPKPAAPAADVKPQDDLHKMMEGGVY